MPPATLCLGLCKFTILMADWSIIPVQTEIHSAVATTGWVPAAAEMPK